MTGTDKQNDKPKLTAPPPKYTQEDFFDSTSPYEEVYSYHENPFQMERQLTIMSLEARRVGVLNFKKLFNEYVKSLKRSSSEIYVENSTNFQNQPIELDAGEWQADDLGISKSGPFGEEVACCHPIMPVERLVNIDTGAEKLKIAYSKGKRWRELIADKKTLASNNSILSLADQGVAVTSENAKALVKYISDVENLNYDKIPEKKSVSRLGYIDGEGFSPYVDGLIFDGDANFRATFESIKSVGSRKTWLTLAQQIRRGNVMARIVLAASFASVLVAPTGALPFFVHLWGGESGTGKTVALMLAASVWGSPEMGRYIQTFNSTVVGREKLASFLNNLPLMVDELQLARDSRGKLMFDVYSLAEGVGRTRGTKTGGVERTPTWANTILTTGETPITSAGAGAGAVNRVIEIECKSADKIIEDGHTVSSIVKKNYGHAGREFVLKLYENDANTELAAQLYKEYFKKFTENDTTEKQAMAAAVIITADWLATKWIFQDDRALTVDDLSKFLASRAAVSSGSRGYQYMCDWVAQNSNKFSIDAKQGDIYGTIEEETVGSVRTGRDIAYIINSTFRRAVEDAGFSATALLSFLRENNLILTRGRNSTRGKRINGVNVECVALKMPLIDGAQDGVTAADDLPFDDEPL